MFDLASASIGAISSLVVSLFCLNYQNWKGNARTRVSIFYQAKKQVNLNLEAIALSQSFPDKKDILLDKVQFLPTYPFSTNDPTDTAFRALSEHYNLELLHAVSGDIEYFRFEKISSNRLRALDIMLTQWNPLLNGTVLDYFLYKSICWNIPDLKQLLIRLKSKIKK